MSRFLNAWRAFVKAWKNPLAGECFLRDQGEEKKEVTDPSHLRLLALLQSKGRLIDFLNENIDGFDDAQVGSVVRQVHKECAQLIEDYVTLKPLLESEEGAEIDIPKDYDATAIKVVGDIHGAPPYRGVVVHRGWKAMKRSLPKKLGECGNAIVAPAEVEIKG